MIKKVKTPQQNVRWLFKEGTGGQWGSIVQDVLVDSTLDVEKLKRARVQIDDGVVADLPDQQRISEKVYMLTWYTCM